MRVRNLIGLFEMTQPEAVAVFQRLGVDPGRLDPDGLKKAYRGLIAKNHPDRGGDLVTAQQINAAYDVLRNKPAMSRPNRSRAGTWDDVRRNAETRNRNWENEQDNPIWSHAGYSGGAPNSSTIYRQDYRDMNFIKKSMWEKSGKSNEEWTIMGHDGHYFRNSLTVYGNPSIFPEMAYAMYIWQTQGGNPYQCHYVFAQPRGMRNLYILIGVDKGAGWIETIPPIEFDMDEIGDPDLSHQANERLLMKKVDERLSQLNESGLWAPKPRTEERKVQLDYDLLKGKAFRITDPVGHPDAPGFSVITPMDPWWPKATDRPEFEYIVKQRLNDPTFLPDHKYYQIVQTAQKLRLL